MDIKSLRLSNLKAGAEDGLEEGQVLAYASTWTREPDSYGDVVKRGAFADTIQEWKDSSNTLPVLYGHDTVDPFSNLGGAIEMAEDGHGLLVKVQLDLENPKAKQVYRMLKGRRINQLSFAYDTLEDGIVDLGDEKTARELRKLKVYEISFVPMGANQDTEVLAVKAIADGMKAGRVLSTKNLESLIAARDTLSSVIEAATPTEDVVKASPADLAAKEQELKAAKSRARSAEAVASFTDWGYDPTSL